MKSFILILLFFVASLDSCCPTKNCIDGGVNVIPFFDGIYQLPAIPIKNYYIIVDGDASHKLTYPNGVFPSPINCESDLPSINLDCCKKYKFSLYVSFDGPLGDMNLDSAIVKVKNENGCFIFDSDPNHNQ